MSAQLRLDEILDTAKTKLGVVSSCLNDSHAFARHLTEFDEWLLAHKTELSAASQIDDASRQNISEIISQITKLELQARYNARLVNDMQTHLHNGNNGTGNDDSYKKAAQRARSFNSQA